MCIFRDFHQIRAPFLADEVYVTTLVAVYGLIGVVSTEQKSTVDILIRSDIRSTA